VVLEDVRLYFLREQFISKDCIFHLWEGGISLS
jgi:hypothetical protein